MATSRQPLMPGWLIPGSLTALLSNSYLHHVLAFSFEQALLSALCSVLPAILLAHVFCNLPLATRMLLVPPMAAVIADGLHGGVAGALQQPALWQATFTSLRIALGAGLLCIMLMWSSREPLQRLLTAQAMDMSSMLILAMTGIVLASSFFLLFNATVGSAAARRRHRYIHQRADRLFPMP